MMNVKQPTKIVSLVTAASLALSLSLMAGCANNTAKTNQGMKSQQYGNDGYLGTSNANPHIQGPNMTVNDAETAEAMRRSISSLRGVTGAHIIFNGPEVFVTLKIGQNLDARQVPTIEREAATVLRFNYPRYTIHVKSLPQ